MVECPKCQNDETFVQSCRGFQRRIRVDLDRGALYAERGVWKPAVRVDGAEFACADCGGAVRISEKLRKAWRLDDEPINTATSVDLDAIVKQLRKIARGANVNVREELASPPHYVPFESLGIDVSGTLRKRIEDGLGIPLDRLYSHQAEALRHAFNGRNVVVQTPTASGKSLCYLVPTFDSLLKDPNATALYVFPLKALGFDQRKKISQISERFDERLLEGRRFVWPLQFGAETIWMGAYEAETKDSDQTEVKSKARLVVTNPDSLHVKILPWFSTRTGSWDRFLSNLRYVVLDEIHTYRGLFGAHVAYVIRRLRMICERLGSHPQFFCSSATLPDPKSHAEDLVGLPFEAVTESGSPKYRKAFVLWNPGHVDKKAKEGAPRREPTTDAIDILREVLLEKDSPVQTITFMRTLAGVERFNLNLKNRLQSEKNPCAQKTRTYKSTLVMRERNEISEGLLSGQVVHVTATNALELGIDIGDMNACLVIGYPGTVSSTIQQSGRVGRKADSCVVLLLRDVPLEQWFARNPQQFFENLERIEPLRLPIRNPHVLAEQAACAAWDLAPVKGKQKLGGLTEDLFRKYFGENAREIVLEVWKGREFLPPQLRRGAQTYWVIREKFADVYRSIRVPVSVGKFDVQDEDHRVVGLCDSLLVPRDLFPGAIWVNDGRFYESKRISRRERRVDVRHLTDRVDYETVSLPRTRIDCDEEEAATKDLASCGLGRGVVRVHREVSLYKKVPAFSDAKGKEEVLPTHTDPIEYETTAFWLDLPEETLTNLKIAGEDVRNSAHALEHAFRSVFPFIADVDPGDLGSALDVDETPGDDFRCRVYLFDSFSGGTGLSEFAFENTDKLFGAARDLVTSCKCRERAGCPSCVIIPSCEFQNTDLWKVGAEKILAAIEGKK